MTETPTTKFEISGLKELLRELNTFDKRLRRQLTKDFQAVCKPVVDAAKRATPRTEPISGWGRSWTTRSGYKALPWQARLATKNIKAKVSGKKPREYDGRITNLAVFSIAWGGTINTIYDLASKSQTKAGANMVLLELIPTPLGKRITEALKVPTIGIGAGPHTTGQVLVLHDILDVTPGRKARFVKNYLALEGSVQGAVARFVKEVKDGTYPGPEHGFES